MVRDFDCFCFCFYFILEERYLHCFGAKLLYGGEGRTDTCTDTQREIHGLLLALWII